MDKATKICNIHQPDIMQLQTDMTEVKENQKELKEAHEALSVDIKYIKTALTGNEMIPEGVIPKVQKHGKQINQIRNIMFISWGVLLTLGFIIKFVFPLFKT